MVEKVEEGKVRSIGVSNYGVHHLEELEEWQKVSFDSPIHPDHRLHYLD